MKKEILVDYINWEVIEGENLSDEYYKRACRYGTIHGGYTYVDGIKTYFLENPMEGTNEDIELKVKEFLKK